MLSSLRDTNGLSKTAKGTKRQKGQDSQRDWGSKGSKGTGGYLEFVRTEGVVRRVKGGSMRK